MNQLFTITVYSEHNVGLLNQVAIIFTRRGLNIEDVSASRTTIDGVHRLTLTVCSTREMMEQVARQIEKRIDVLRVVLSTDDDIVYQEVALYKMDTKSLMEHPDMEAMLRSADARVLTFTPAYTVIEKTGRPEETESLLEQLRGYGLRQFVRSGRVCVFKSDAGDELAIR